MGYIRICTGGYIDMCRDRSTGRVCGTVAKKRSVGTLGKKKTDRDDVCRACTRHVQIQTGSP